MATLPDLDTSTVGYVAYWNALNHGVSDIDPDDVLTANRIVSYTLYDNGVEGVYNSVLGRNISFRVKEDGWIVVYIDRTHNYGTQETSRSNLTGYWDIVNDWAARPEPSLTQNTLERAVKDLRDNLDNAANTTYNSSDVGLYNYEYPNASTTTMLSAGGAPGSTTYSFSYTSGTDLKYMAATGWNYNNQSYGVYKYCRFEGVTLSRYTNAGEEWGAIDALGRGLVPDPGTTYGHEIDTYQQYGRAALLSLWS